MQETFSVPDVSCGHCKSAIEGALRPLQGVQDATVDVDARTVAVSYDDSVVSRDRLVAEMEDVGYPVAV